MSWLQRSPCVPNSVQYWLLMFVWFLDLELKAVGPCRTEDLVFGHEVVFPSELQKRGLVPSGEPSFPWVMSFQANSHILLKQVGVFNKALRRRMCHHGKTFIREPIPFPFLSWRFEGFLFFRRPRSLMTQWLSTKTFSWAALQNLSGMLIWEFSKSFMFTFSNPF